MRIRKIHYWIILVAFGASLASALFYLNSVKNPDGRGLLFLTIGINQELLGNETSSYELQRASEHFSDIVLGWVKEPSFSRELDAELSYHLTYTGVRQEKQNLIFNLSADSSLYDSGAAKVFLNLIEGRINEYNSNTKAGYVTAMSRYSDLAPLAYDSKALFGRVALTFGLSVIILISLEYAIKNSRRFTPSA